MAPILKITHFAVSKRTVGTLILTSANAVPGAVGIAAKRVYTVGRTTADAAEAAGISAISADGDAAALIARVTQDAPPDPIVHLRGVHSVGNVADTLRKAGFFTEEIYAYDQVAEPLNAAAHAAFAGAGPVVVPLFSPRSARLFSEAAVAATAPIWPVAISMAVSAAAGPALQAQMVCADAPNGEAMRALVQSRIDAACRLETPGRSG